MTEQQPGNTGVAGGTTGADPVPDRREPPDPEGGEQNRDYRNGDEKGVDDDGCAVG
jgi:hypothetical protein